MPVADQAINQKPRENDPTNYILLFCQLLIGRFGKSRFRPFLCDPSIILVQCIQGPWGQKWSLCWTLVMLCPATCFNNECFLPSSSLPLTCQCLVRFLKWTIFHLAKEPGVIACAAELHYSSLWLKERRRKGSAKQSSLMCLPGWLGYASVQLHWLHWYLFLHSSKDTKILL